MGSIGTVGKSPLFLVIVFFSVLTLCPLGSNAQGNFTISEAPVRPNVTEVTENSITIYWYALATQQEVTGYQVDYVTAGFQNWTRLTVTSNRVIQATARDLTIGKTYSFRVRATLTGGVSPWSPSATQLVYLTTALSPKSGLLAGGLSLTIQGRGFQRNSLQWLARFRYEDAAPGTQNADIPEIWQPATVVSDTLLYIASPSVATIYSATATRYTFKHSVALSTDAGTSWAPTGQNYTYYAAPVVNVMSPQRGPVIGGTRVSFSGSNLWSNSEMSCRFGRLVMPAVLGSNGQMQCITPQPEHTSGVEISMNSVNFHDSGYTFQFWGSVIILKIEPSAGVANRGRVRAIGSGFLDVGNELLQCRFGNTFAAATFVSATMVYCNTPSLPTDVQLPLEVSVDGGSVFSSSRRLFTVLPVPVVARVVPDFGTQAGNEIVTILGSNFLSVNDSLLDAHCRYDTGLTRPLTVISTTQIQCLTPPHPPGRVSLQFTFNGEVYYDTMGFTYTDPGNSNARLFSVLPSRAAAGGTRVMMSGFGFNSTTGEAGVFRCRFGFTVVDATFEDSRTLSCVAPDVDIPEGSNLTTSRVSVSINGGSTWTDSELDFTWYRTPAIYSLSPLSGTRFEQLMVTVTVQDMPLSATAQVTCKFGSQGAPIQSLSVTGSTVTCQAPRAESIGPVPVGVSFNGQDYHFNETVVYTFVECPDGHFVDDFAGCTPCPAGTFLDIITAVCKPCDHRSYAASEAMTSCQACPEHMYSVDNTDISSCRCDYGYYLKSEGQCVPCPPGAECLGDKVLPLARVGYWIVPDQPTLSHECFPSQACLGGNQGACSMGYEGFECGICSEGYYRARGECLKCSSNANIYFALLLIAYALVLVMCVVGSGKQRHFGVLNAIYVMASFFQYASLATQVMLPWSKAAKDTVYYSGSFLSLNVEFTSSQCVSGSLFTYIGRTVTLMLFPVVTGVAFALAYAVGRLLVKNDQKYRFGPHVFIPETAPVMHFKRNLKNTWLYLAGTAYLPLMRKVIEAFQCVEQPDGSYTFYPDPSLRCYEKEWNTVLALAIANIIVYGFGLPVVFTRLFWSPRRDHHSHLMRRLSFVAIFKQSRIAYHATILQRKAACAYLMLALSYYPVAQVVAGALVCGIAFVHHITRAWPYKGERYSFFHALVLASASLFFMIGIFSSLSSVTDPTWLGRIGQALVGIVALGWIVLFGNDLVYLRRLRNTEIDFNFQKPDPENKSVLMLRRNYTKGDLKGETAVDPNMGTPLSQNVLFCDKGTILVTSEKEIRTKHWVFAEARDTSQEGYVPTHAVTVLTGREAKSHLKMWAKIKNAEFKVATRMFEPDMLPFVFGWLNEPRCGHSNTRFLREVCSQIFIKKKEIETFAIDRGQRHLQDERGVAMLRKILSCYTNAWITTEYEYFLLRWMVGDTDDHSMKMARVLVNMFRSLENWRRFSYTYFSERAGRSMTLSSRFFKPLPPPTATQHSRAAFLLRSILGDVIRPRMLSSLTERDLSMETFFSTPLAPYLQSSLYFSPLNVGFEGLEFTNLGHKFQIPILGEVVTQEESGSDSSSYSSDTDEDQFLNQHEGTPLRQVVALPPILPPHGQTSPPRAPLDSPDRPTVYRKLPRLGDPTKPRLPPYSGLPAVPEEPSYSSNQFEKPAKISMDNTGEVTPPHPRASSTDNKVNHPNAIHTPSDGIPAEHSPGASLRQEIQEHIDGIHREESEILEQQQQTLGASQQQTSGGFRGDSFVSPRVDTSPRRPTASIPQHSSSGEERRHPLVPKLQTPLRMHLRGDSSPAVSSPLSSGRRSSRRLSISSDGSQPSSRLGSSRHSRRGSMAAHLLLSGKGAEEAMAKSGLEIKGSSGGFRLRSDSNPMRPRSGTKTNILSGAIKKKQPSSPRAAREDKNFDLLPKMGNADTRKVIALDDHALSNLTEEQKAAVEKAMRGAEQEDSSSDEEW